MTSSRDNFSILSCFWLHVSFRLSQYIPNRYRGLEDHILNATLLHLVMLPSTKTYLFHNSNICYSFHCWPWHHHWPWFKFQKAHPWHCCTSRTTGFTHTSMLHFTQTSPPCQSLYCICPTSLGIFHSSLVSSPCLSHQSPRNCPTRVYKAHPWFLELFICCAFK